MKNNDAVATTFEPYTHLFREHNIKRVPSLFQFFPQVENELSTNRYRTQVSHFPACYAFLYFFVDKISSVAKDSISIIRQIYG